MLKKSTLCVLMWAPNTPSDHEILGNYHSRVTVVQLLLIGKLQHTVSRFLSDTIADKNKITVCNAKSGKVMNQ